MNKHPNTAFAMFQENFQRVLDFLSETNKNFIVGGDTNINLLNYNQLK